MKKSTHLDERGRLRMIDVSGKPVTVRRARAKGAIYLQQSTLDTITENQIAKGDVFAVARIAGIQAAKHCDDLIPLCHTLPLDHVSVDLRAVTDPPRVEITSEVTCAAKTGAEMEALLAVSIAALTVYDMVKSIERSARIGDIRLVEKSGGKSGTIRTQEP